MQIRKAAKKDIDAVNEICRRCIFECYAKYYSKGAVERFAAYHGIENITDAVLSGEVYVICNGEKIIGTMSRDKNELYRFFVLPEYQGKGYGGKLLSYCENEVFKDNNTIMLGAALSSFNMYIKKGYELIEYKEEQCENGDVLCWFEMVKKKP